MLCHQVFFIILFLFLLYFSILPRFLRIFFFFFFTSFSLEFMRTVCVIYDKKEATTKCHLCCIFYLDYWTPWAQYSCCWWVFFFDHYSVNFCASLNHHHPKKNPNSAKICYFQNPNVKTSALNCVRYSGSELKNL